MFGVVNFSGVSLDNFDDGFWKKSLDLLCDFSLFFDEACLGSFADDSILLLVSRRTIIDD